MLSPYESEHHEYIANKYSKELDGFPLIDCSYPYALDEKSASRLRKTFKLIRNLGDYQPRKKWLLDTYWTELNRFYNDQTVKFEVLPEPLQIGYAEDRVVFSGLERIAQLATGKSANTFTFYRIGTGSNPVLPSDVGLHVEEASVNMDETGFAESKGSTMQFAGIFPTNIPTMSISEAGIFDAKFDPSTLFLRTVYSGSNIINHQVNQTYIAISHIVYLISV